MGQALARKWHVRKAKPGDLIEIYRGLYKHWGVYVGSGCIVHVASSSDVSGANTDSLRSAPIKKAIVKKEELWDVVGTDRWKISNSLDEEYEPRSGGDIVSEACAKVGEKLPYSVFNRNCEHFANEMRYGKAESRQAEDGKTYIKGSMKAGLGLFFASLVGGMFKGDNEENEKTDTKTS